MKSSCILVFARESRAEARAKRLRRGRAVFDYAQARLQTAAARMPDVDLVVCGASPVAAAGRFLAQRGASFGERLENAFADALARGYERVVAAPIDVPRLGLAHLRQALDALATRSLVYGPSPDGGVYLLGLRAEALPRLRGVRWQSSRVSADLSRDAAVLRDCLRDIDGAEDVIVLASEPRLPPELRSLLSSIAAHAAWLPSPPRVYVQGRDLSAFGGRPPPLLA